MAHRYHRLKIWPENMGPLIQGKMTCQIRKADRDYREGDYLLLEEFDPKPSVKANLGPSGYTGRTRVALVTHIQGAGLLMPVGDHVIAPATRPADRMLVLSIAQPAGLPPDAEEIKPGDGKGTFG